MNISPRILLLDTDAASNLQRGKLRDDYKAILDTYDLLAITWISEAEWQAGHLQKANSERQTRYENWLTKVLRISHDQEITTRWAELAAVAAQRNQKVKYRQNDTWIAAAAIRHGIPLMTLNRSDFEVFARYGALELEPPI